MNIIFCPFIGHLNDEIVRGYFQKGGATEHIALFHDATAQYVLGQNISNWPPLSPDLALSDCYLWGKWKAQFTLSLKWRKSSQISSGTSLRLNYHVSLQIRQDVRVYRKVLAITNICNLCVRNTCILICRECVNILIVYDRCTGLFAPPGQKRKFSWQVTVVAKNYINIIKFLLEIYLQQFPGFVPLVSLCLSVCPFVNMS